jgi:hypothetical protein
LRRPARLRSVMPAPDAQGSRQTNDRMSGWSSIPICASARLPQESSGSAA